MTDWYEVGDGTLPSSCCTGAKKDPCNEWSEVGLSLSSMGNIWNNRIKLHFNTQSIVWGCYSVMKTKYIPDT